MTHAEQHAHAVKEWEAQFKAGRFESLPNLDDNLMASLPDSTVEYLATFVLPAGLELRLGPEIEGQHLIQIVGDDVVGWLGCCGQCGSHTWGAPDFGDVDNHAALASLCARAPESQALNLTRPVIELFLNRYGRRRCYSDDIASG